ncbi:MAG: HAMP domain-containing histidine kinase [Pseudomonadales bacterium]|nr:HAMP domain-containing histidine kinase [Pseudomonadales bacterium]
MLASFKSVVKSYAFRFYITISAIFIAVGLVIFAGLFAYIAHQQAKGIHSSLEQQLAGAREVYLHQGLDEFRNYIAPGNVEYSLEAFYYVLVDPGLNKIAGDLAAWPASYTEKQGRIFFNSQRLAPDRQSTISLQLTALSSTLPDGNQLLVARNLRLVQVFVQNYRFVLVLFFCVATLLSLIIAFIFSWLTLNRLEKFNQGIEQIMQGDLTQRFEVGHSKSEAEELARNLNKMLNVIATLIEDVKRVSDNIAHDLRTPLTRHRNNLVSMKNKLDATHGEALQELIIESDQLLATFNALLRIARIESGNVSPTMAPITFRPLLNDVIELYEPLAADAGIEIKTELKGDPVILGDRNLLFQAIANLIDNAIKFTPGGGTISIRLLEYLTDSGYPVLNALAKDCDRQSGLISLEIADSGPGVESNNYKKMFQRFYREEQSRSVKPGNGLGLSMVYATMNFHKGAILVDNNRPGLIIRLAFRRH